MCKLTIIEAGKCTEVPVEAGAQVAEMLRERVPAFAMPCAGNHTCGKCRVRVRGQVSAVTEAERALLSDRELSQGIRLACSCRVLGEASVALLEEKAGKIVSWYDLPVFEHTEDGCGLAVDIGTTTVAVQLSGKAGAWLRNGWRKTHSGGSARMSSPGLRPVRRQESRRSPSGLRTSWSLWPPRAWRRAA